MFVTETGQDFDLRGQRVGHSVPQTEEALSQWATETVDDRLRTKA